MELRSILDRFHKGELQDIGNVLGWDMPSRLRRSQMVDRLVSYLQEEPDRWLSYLMERDIHLLRDLVKAGPERVQYLDYEGYPSIVEVSGLVESDDSDQHHHRVWISREIYDIVSPVIDTAIKRVERSGQYRMERVGLGYLSLYGVIPTDAFMNLMMDWYERHFGQDYSAMRVFLERSPLVKVCRFQDSYGDNICSPCINDVPQMMELCNEYRGRKLKSTKHFPEDEVIEAGSGAPYFVAGMKTPEGKALEDIYIKLGYTGFELVKALHDTWVESQYTAQSNPALFDPIYYSPKASDVPDSIWEEYCLAVCDYADNAPKWCLGGRTAAETGKCLCDRDAWRIPDAPEQDVADEPEYPVWTMPEPTVSEGFGAMSSDFPIGFAIPHVAANDPCPCGSGLRYCRCHGKYLS